MASTLCCLTRRRTFHWLQPSHTRRFVRPLLPTRMLLTSSDSSSSSSSGSAGTLQPTKPRLQQVHEELQLQEESLSHLLKFPARFVGSVRPTKASQWLLCEENNCMTKQPVRYVPALYKIFDDLVTQVVTSATTKTTYQAQDPQLLSCWPPRPSSPTRLDVTIDLGTKDNGFKPCITVLHDGQGIPIEYHDKEQVYTPELLVGHLVNTRLSRTHKLDQPADAQLTNIFSHEFMVETADSSTGLKYKQVWTDNMRNRSEPMITTLGCLENDFTRLTFSPDLARFGMTRLPPSMVKVFKKRVVELAGCLPNVEVTLNGEHVPVAGFHSFVKTFEGSTTMASQQPQAAAHATRAVKCVFVEASERWQIGVLPSDMGFVQVSFVNGMPTKRGGSHVDLVANQLCQRIADHINRQFFLQQIKVTPQQVKAHLALFVNCKVENPTFDSLLRERMTRNLATVQPICEEFLNKVVSDAQIVERVVQFVSKRKQQQQLRRTRRLVSASPSHTSVKALPRARGPNRTVRAKN